eukprot:1157802-Pelagomonas_calceolata.AAC.3
MAGALLPRKHTLLSLLALQATLFNSRGKCLSVLKVQTDVVPGRTHLALPACLTGDSSIVGASARVLLPACFPLSALCSAFTCTGGIPAYRTGARIFYFCPGNATCFAPLPCRWQSNSRDKWQFNSQGKCTSIPQIDDPKAHATACNSPRSCAASYPTKVGHALLIFATLMCSIGSWPWSASLSHVPRPTPPRSGHALFGAKLAHQLLHVQSSSRVPSLMRCALPHQALAMLSF